MAKEEPKINGRSLPHITGIAIDLNTWAKSMEDIIREYTKEEEIVIQRREVINQWGNKKSTLVINGFDTGTSSRAIAVEEYLYHKATYKPAGEGN